MNAGIVGSRNFTDEAFFSSVLEGAFAIFNLTCFVSGGALGADSMAAAMAHNIGLDLIEHLPDRERYGWPRAAFERNTLIVNDSNILFAFFGPGEPPSVNKSGTMDSVRKAIAKRIPVHLYFQS